MYLYTTRGICAKQISFDINNGAVTNVTFYGGCPGNLKGIGKLVEGMPAEEVIERLRGITCGGKLSSCPDQLSRAIEESITRQVG